MLSSLQQYYMLEFIPRPAVKHPAKLIEDSHIKAANWDKTQNTQTSKKFSFGKKHNKYMRKYNS